MNQEKPKKRSQLMSAIVNTFLIVPILFSFINKLTELVKAEASLAARNIIIIIMIAVISACLLTGTWVCVLITLFFWLTQYSISPVQTMLIIILINFLLLLILGLTVTKLQKTIFFPKTRSQLCKYNEE